jgi:prolyl oligopeptidase family protein
MLLKTFASLGDDILVYQDKENPQWMFSVDVAEDGKYLVMYISKDCSKVRYILHSSDYFLPHYPLACRSRKISYGFPTSTRTVLAQNQMDKSN